MTLSILTMMMMMKNHLPARQSAPPRPTAARLRLAHHPRILPLLVVLVVVRTHLLQRIGVIGAGGFGIYLDAATWSRRPTWLTWRGPEVEEI